MSKQTDTSKKTAVIIGAGPAGLTAAFELQKQTDIHPVIVEATSAIGGISQTVVHNGNRMDIGGHRFFSKSDRVLDWWLEIMPLESGAGEVGITYQGKEHTVVAAAGAVGEREDSFLVRERHSRIFFNGTFFDYPLSLSWDTLRKLGLYRLIRISCSYIWRTITPNREELNLEDFFINRFGRELYETFFKSYTEKVWGKSCTEISAEWGRQRVKGLSLRTAIADAIARPFRRADVRQKEVETSLIQRFLYPAFGPGQMWEKVAEHVQAAGAQLHMNTAVIGIDVRENRVHGVQVQRGSVVENIQAEAVFSTMPIQHLIAGIDNVPTDIAHIADGLEYRDFVAVGILVDRTQLMSVLLEAGHLIQDNWIYVQEPHVRVGRIQIFNNWSPFMVADPENTVWFGMEYFTNIGDDFWSMTDDEIVQLAARELVKLGFVTGDPTDSTVVRMPKAYPAYTGSYVHFQKLREYIDSIDGLYVIGRNGMHKYNNQDHSMLTAMLAVDVIQDKAQKADIWAVNTEQEYIEGAS